MAHQPSSAARLGERGPHRLLELGLIFLKLGATSLGGPIAHIARMEDELVTRRQWLTRQHFLDLVGATNLIPGPNSTELAIHIGQLRAGWAGLFVAGISFIVPAMLLALLLAWWYVDYGKLPAARSILYGAQPVVVAIVAQALGRFLRTALKNTYTWLVAAGSVALLGAGVGELNVIAASALVGLIAGALAARREGTPAESTAPHHTDIPRDNKLPAFFLVLGSGSLAVTPTLGSLFLVFLKIGSIIYGSGYVLLAFLRSDLVENAHWITEQQLLDAVVIGQVTPGPVFTTATFIGYLVGTGHNLNPVAAALCATLGIFLPSFVFVALLTVVLERWKHSTVLRWFLDAVNAASLILMAAVTWQLLHAAVTSGPKGSLDFVALILAVGTLTLLHTTRLNSAWWLAAGATIGLLTGPH